MANRILVGSRTVGGYGLYISKSGVDVLTCAKGDLSFWTDHGESGNAFVSKGLGQMIPTSVSSGGVPVETGSVTVQADVANTSAAWLPLTTDEDVMVMGVTKGQLDGFDANAPNDNGFAADDIVSSITTTGATFTCVAARTFNFVVWKTLGKGETLY